LLFILLGKVRQTKRRQNWWVVQEPTIQSCGGDRKRADRLE
jgi:hypothetical protein